MQTSIVYYIKTFKKKLKEFLQQAVMIMPIKYSISIENSSGLKAVADNPRIYRGVRCNS